MKQSPVNIILNDVIVDRKLSNPPLKLSYKEVIPRTIVNGGHGWRINVTSEKHNLEGGPLKYRYRLQHVYSHWGITGREGSEHKINGNSFAAELQFVHTNVDLYRDYEKAACSENGLAILSIFFKEGKTHSELERICHLVRCIKHKGSKCYNIAPLDINAFLPKGKPSYWTYEGSLTTPPFYESVTWIIIKDPLEVSNDQLDVFRALVSYRESDESGRSSTDGLITQNWRPLQPLGGRIVRTADK